MQSGANTSCELALNLLQPVLVEGMQCWYCEISSCHREERTGNDGGQRVAVLLVRLHRRRVLAALLGNKGDPLVALRQHMTEEEAELLSTLQGEGRERFTHATWDGSASTRVQLLKLSASMSINSQVTTAVTIHTYYSG